MKKGRWKNLRKALVGSLLMAIMGFMYLTDVNVAYAEEVKIESEEDLIVEEISEEVIDENTGGNINYLELNTKYYIEDFQNGVYTTIPNNGRIKLLIEDVKSINQSKTYDYNIYDNNQETGCVVGRDWKVYTDSMDSGWITMVPGEYRFRLGLSRDELEESSLTILYQPINPLTMECENNDTFDSANILPINTWFEGNYSNMHRNNHDMDYLKLIMEKPGSVEFSLKDMEGNPGKDYFATLCSEDKNGNVEKIDWIKDSWRIRLDKGNYFISVNTFNASGEDEYAIKANVIYEESEKYEQESNNVRSKANIKNINTSYIGNLGTEDDVDWFRFEAPKGWMALEFRIPRQSPERAYNVYLYDSTLNELDAYTTSSDPYYLGDEKLYNYGIYYIKIEKGSGNFVNSDYEVCLKNREYTYLSEITFPYETIEIYENEQKQLKPTLLPSDAVDKKVVWDSSNYGIVSVDSKGKIQGIKAGTAEVKVRALNKYSVSSAVTIIVKKKPKLNKESVSIIAGKAYTLKLNNADGEITWKSSNPSIATVDKNGVIHANKLGTTKVTAKYENMYFFCTITVKPIFKSGTWYASSKNTVYRFKIYSVSGKKFSYYIKMPYQTVSKQYATINSNGKIATSKFKCKDKKTHTLNFTIVNDKIKVVEKTSCKKKVISNYAKSSKSTISRYYYKKSYWE